LEEGKAGKIMTKQKIGIFLGRLRLTVNHCAEIFRPPSHQIQTEYACLRTSALSGVKSRVLSASKARH